MGRGGCVVLGLVGLVLLAVGVTWVAKARALQERAYCANNLRRLSQFTEYHARLHPDRPLFVGEKAMPALTADERAKLEQAGGPDSVPPGTIVNAALPPDQRLSWVVHLLPLLGGPSAESLDLTAAWDAPQNQAVARTSLAVLLCYGKPAIAPADQPAVTQYVGNGGVGPDAPAKAWPAVNKPHPQAGAFRYDAPTAFAAFLDGTSGSVLFAETDASPGPWLRGGISTVRTLDGDGPPVGVGRPFGGLHPGGASFAFADHSVRFLSDRTAPEVLRALFTIAGGTADSVPGD